VLTDPEHVKMWKATEEPTIHNTTVRLLILTGQRKGEISAANTRLLFTQPENHMSIKRSHEERAGAAGVELDVGVKAGAEVRCGG
jgi:hypothetical protein